MKYFWVGCNRNMAYQISSPVWWYSISSIDRGGGRGREGGREIAIDEI